MVPTPSGPLLECLLSNPSEQAVSQGGKGPLRPHHNEQRAPGLQYPALSQEADEVAGSGLGKWKDREMG